MRSSVIVAALSAAAIATTGAVAAPAGKSDVAKGATRIALPAGQQPEGIAAGPGNQLFVGSIPTGAVLRVNARTGATETVVQGETQPTQPPARAAIGLKFDNKRNRLFVAGGPTGKAFVYDAASGRELKQFQLAPDATTFVNDVTLTRRWAYFTDSRRAAIYAVARNRELSRAREIPLSGLTLAPGTNLNGIVATPAGRYLLAVQSASGSLWRINPGSGRARQVDLGGAALTNGDGLLLEGRRLYVVQNRSNQVAIVRLRNRFRTGTVVRTLTSTEFDVPTTIARKGRFLYLVNARFGTPSPATAAYWVTRIKAG